MTLSDKGLKNLERMVVQWCHIASVNWAVTGSDGGLSSVMCQTFAYKLTRTWGPPGSCRPQMGLMMAQWTLLSGCSCCWFIAQIWYSLSAYYWKWVTLAHQNWSTHCGLVTSYGDLDPRSLLAQVIVCAWQHEVSTRTNEGRWLIISKVLRCSPQGNFTRNAQDTSHWYDFDNYLFNIKANFWRIYECKRQNRLNRNRTVVPFTNNWINLNPSLVK